MIILDYNDKRPIYEQIVDKMQRLIAGGALEPDEKLPSVRSLAVELSINPNTIQRAYSELERSGFIYSVKGRGNFVRADEHLKEKQQRKLLDALEKQLISCREQGTTREIILASVDYIYPVEEGSRAGSAFDGKEAQEQKRGRAKWSSLKRAANAMVTSGWTPR